jgi:hypothetical protein
MRQAQLQHSSQQSHDGTMPAPRLQRKCACGGTCGDCAEDRRLRRTTANGARGPVHAPPIVHDALRAQGRPLDDTTRAYMEPRFGHDFSRVRVHSGDTAARSAAAVNARAYTVGQHIVLGGSAPSPATREGRSLLAHELTHVVQQRDVVARSAEPIEIGHAGDPHERDAETLARAVVSDRPVTAPDRRSGLRLQASILDSVVDTVADIFGFIPRLFGAAWFTTNELREYLDGLRQRHAIEDNMFSDNKARACVDRESEFGPYDVAMKTLLVREMTTGHVSFLDEGSTITLLRRAQVAERQQIVTAIGRDRLWSKFDGGNRRILEALTMTAADANDALVGRLRTLAPDELQDYQRNITDPALQAAIRRASVMARTTAPVPNTAQLTPQGNLTVRINGIDVIVESDDALSDPAQANYGGTACGVHPDHEPTPFLDAAGNVSRYSPPTMLGLLKTSFAPGADPTGRSAYGRGTTETDVAAGNTSLRFHESRHGQDCFDFISRNPVPQFNGPTGVTQAVFDQAVLRWHAAVSDYNDRAAMYSLRNTDCVGTLPTDAQLAPFHLTTALCRPQ